MAAVMAKAIHIDDNAIQEEQERMISIEAENRGLRELLKISGIPVGDHVADKSNKKETSETEDELTAPTAQEKTS